MVGVRLPAYGEREASNSEHGRSTLLQGAQAPPARSHPRHAAGMRGDSDPAGPMARSQRRHGRLPRSHAGLAGTDRARRRDARARSRRAPLSRAAGVPAPVRRGVHKCRVRAADDSRRDPVPAGPRGLPGRRSRQLRGRGCARHTSLPESRYGRLAPALAGMHAVAQAGRPDRSSVGGAHGAEPGGARPRGRHGAVHVRGLVPRGERRSDFLDSGHARAAAKGASPPYVRRCTPA